MEDSGTTSSWSSSSTRPLRTDSRTEGRTVEPDDGCADERHQAPLDGGSFCGSQASEKLDMMKTIKDYKTVGRGCGSVGRVVASNTRDPRCVTGHRQNFIYLLNNKTIKETKIKEEAGNGPSKKMQD